MERNNNSDVIVKPVKKKYINKKALTNLIKYTWQKEKAIHKLYGGYGSRTNNAELAAKDFIETRKIFQKFPSTFARHKVISFENGLLSTPQQVFEVAKEVVTYYTDNFQVIYGVHEDRDENYHIHLIINSVNYKNGKIFHEGLPDNAKFQEYIRNIIKFHQ